MSTKKVCTMNCGFAAGDSRKRADVMLTCEDCVDVELPHPDDIAVDRFAAKMKEKLALSRSKGRNGWDDPTRCTVEYLSLLLRAHVGKGDPVDVANFCMMLQQRGSGIVGCESIHSAIEIRKIEGEQYYTKTVSLASCPHCHDYELIVSDVEVSGRDPAAFPQAVHCGGCGARGPWGDTEERAVTRWNNSQGVKTISQSEWQLVPLSDDTETDDFPF